MFVFRDMAMKKKDLPSPESVHPGYAYLVLTNHHMYTPARKSNKIVWFDLGKFPPKGPERNLKEEKK